MNDIRRTILWVIFGFSMVLLWDQWQVHNGKKATFFPSPVQQKAAVADGAKPVVPVAAASAGTAAPVAPAAEPGTPKERFEVSTDVLKLTLDTEGGTLVRSELLKYAETGDKSKNIVLLDDSKDRVYRAQTGVVASEAGGAFPTHKTVMSVSGPRVLAEGENEISIKFTSPDVGGIKLVKTYTLRRGAYDIAVKHELVNTSSVAISPQLYLQLERDGTSPPGGSSFYSTFTGPAVYTEAKKFQKVDFSDIKKDKADFEKTSSNGYIAMVQHYFASAWLLPDGVKRNLSMTPVTLDSPVADCCYRVVMVSPVESIAPGASKTVDAKLFVGPLEEKMLESLAPGMELLKDYGRLTILAKPLYWLLDKLHSFIQNWGWSIVALVLLLKIAFYWLNAKAYSSMAKMKAINPKIMEMRERLKDSPQQMQQEMMKIYREEKVNPLGGCFPIVVQIPVFIALYTVLLSTIEMRDAPWIFWIHDLSSKDPMYILPVLMTMTTLLQTALNPAPPDPMQAKMMWIMPLAFSVMFFAFPAGLVLYWITNNILSIAQQWIINTRMGVPPQFNLPKFK
ncbi:membrane protein insertase YidC [Rhodoferax saidenbachensis]|uniref:Membrane protein insertase YidC n=1 Tax=Rhodoferax saidenbachensis TaxID=1484693 RepID=A0ABU1ZPC0_9BURK|nr:membrane protein insertase YidC [Rhodoferax saidenbachensis]MDR7307378.1 YidC/Oxa1 family membrane protein insertase [Rhodoferax saidenbachensis]